MTWVPASEERAVAAIDERSMVPDDDPSTVAQSVVQLITDTTRRDAVVAEQHRFVDEMFTMDAVGKRYLELIEQRRRR